MEPNLSCKKFVIKTKGTYAKHTEWSENKRLKDTSRLFVKLLGRSFVNCFFT